jgi:hypothetical protein
MTNIKETLIEYKHTIELVLRTDKNLSKENIIRLTELKEKIAHAGLNDNKTSKKEIIQIIELGIEVCALGATIAALYSPG